VQYLVKYLLFPPGHLNSKLKTQVEIKGNRARLVLQGFLENPGDILQKHSVTQGTMTNDEDHIVAENNPTSNCIRVFDSFPIENSLKNPEIRKYLTNFLNEKNKILICLKL